ncbi:MAG: glycosyltransferase family 39 protein [Anaerolineae bacterium]|nr:glycosyltransferase family 39 protein [Anaerolineae bacterium]
MPGRRAYITIGVLALLWGLLLAILVEQPGYVDAYYYFNAGQRFAQGEGLTDANLWTYINAPDTLPGPSHAYWMPLESLVAAASMAIFGAHFGAAQMPSVLCFTGLVLLAFWLGAHLGGTSRHAWIAGLLMLFSGFFTPFWTSTDTFALYGLVGSLALVTLGRGRESGDWRWYAASGALGGLAHLTRADGLLLILVALLIIFWPRWGFAWMPALKAAVACLIAYTVIMSPWWVRNAAELGTPFPTGGMAGVWLRGYEEIVNFPPDMTFAGFREWGLSPILESRWVAFTNNLGTFIAVETWVVLGPFVLTGLWILRRQPLLWGVMLYALGLHLAMTFVFAYPGYRGGLFHSSSALMPFWAAMSIVGLDAAILWLAKRRRWRRKQAQTVFGGAAVILAAIVSISLLFARLPDMNDNGNFYRTIANDLPLDVVVMVNDPAGFYYHTGHLAVVVPNNDPDVVPEIAEKYGVTHLVLDVNRTDPFTALFLGEEDRSFLREIKHYTLDTDDPADDWRVFVILPDDAP